MTDLERKLTRLRDHLDLLLLDGVIDHEQYLDGVQDLEKWALGKYLALDKNEPVASPATRPTGERQ